METDPQAGNTTIVVRDLVKRYEDVTALNGLTLEIRPGELFGLLGPNGAGKTTLINILSGINDPSEGSVTIAGFSMPAQADRVRNLIGVCPQDTAVYDYLTGRENVELFGALHAMSSGDVRLSADDLLDRLSLSGDADRRVGKFSGGMRRRINLIMALVHDPRIAFLDEPTVAMDPQSRRAVWDFIRSLRERGKTIILTTHYMEEAEELCDRVGIIDHGKLIALGSPEELREQHGSEDLEDVFIKLTGRSIREGV